MKNLYVLVPIAVLLTTSKSQAFIPEREISLADHVAYSSHIFVGEILDVYCVSNYGKPITTLQARKEAATDDIVTTETKLRVRGTLLARKTQLPRIVYFRTYRHLSGYFAMGIPPTGLNQFIADSKKEIGQSSIWMTEIEQRPKKVICFSSYSYYYLKDISRRGIIKATIEDEKFKWLPHIIRPNKSDSMILLN